jgi:transmembrane sensor
MTASRQPDDDAARDDSESRELADYLAGQDPLDVQAALWLARRLDGLTAEEDAELRAWLAGDPARGARLEQLAGVWGQLGELPPEDLASLRTALPPAPALTPGHEPAARPPQPRNTAHTPTPRTAAPARLAWMPDWSRLLPQAAMAGLAALLIGGGWLGWNHWQQQPTFTQNYATQRGQQLSASLPDGSGLRLDTATRLDATLYRQRREVRLAEGQALFEVRADPQRPFHVLAGAMRITVLGTRFTVRHMPDGSDAGKVSVTVEEGRVRVTRATGATQPGEAWPVGEGVVLTAGEQVMADARGHIGAVARVNPAAGQAWREGRVEFDGTPLAEAIAEIERYVDTGLVIADPTVAALRLNGSFDLRQAHSFRQVLPLALPVRLVERGGVTEIVAR